MATPQTDPAKLLYSRVQQLNGTICTTHQVIIIKQGFYSALDNDNLYLLVVAMPVTHHMTKHTHWPLLTSGIDD